jgi:ketose-bisphosphate aldolase
MSLVSLKEILADAQKREYAIGGFNVFNFETLCAVVEVAEELKTPLAVGIPERLFNFVDVDTLSAAMIRAAAKATVPVSIHLDHARTYEGIIKALRWGFTSIMFDGSSLSFDNNLKRTKEIVKMGRSLDICVEGEIGYGKDEALTLEMAAEFAAKTGIDSLAIDIDKDTDTALSRIKDLNSAVKVPLVLHGGSKLTQTQYKKAIKSGITKINIATDMSEVAVKALRNEIGNKGAANYINLMALVKKSVKDSVRKYMLAFDCISKTAS